MIRAAAFCASLALAWPVSGAVAAPVPPPPPGYVADGYVDAAGCRFRRARVDDAVVWGAVQDASGVPLCRPPDPAAMAVMPPHRGGRPPFPSPGAHVQVGLFADTERADLYARQIAAAGFGVVVQDFARPGGRVQRVLFAGPLDDPAAAAAALAAVRALGFADAFVWQAPEAEAP